jgi:hypothetical protein
LDAPMQSPRSESRNQALRNLPATAMGI